MDLKGFLVVAIQSALDLGMASSDDVVRHVTPDVLAAHLPRPLWARLLTACVGAPKVDAQLVVETIGVPNLCEHIPSAIMWACLEEIGVRAIGGTYVPRPAAAAAFGFGLAAGTGAVPVSNPTTPASGPAARPTPVPLSINAPPEIVAPALPVTATQPSPVVGPDIPGIADIFTDPTVPPEDRPTGPLTGNAANRQRTPTSQRFRATSTGIGRLAAGARRPQANASAPASDEAAPPPPPRAPNRRAATDSEYEVVTDVATKGSDDWKNALAVEDEQLVDWSGSEETTTGSTDDAPRKR